MKRIIVFTAAMLFSVCAYSGTGDDIKKLIEEQKYSEAAVLLDREIEGEPKNITLRNMRGSMYVDKLKEPEKAIDDFTYIINASEKSKNYDNAAMGYYNRGNAYLWMKRYEDAIEDYSKAIVLRGKSNYYLNRATAYLNVKMPDKAFEDINSAIELDPDFMYIHLSKATYHVHKEEYGLAAESYKKAIEAGDTRAIRATYYNITESYLHTGDFKSALHYLKEYIKKVEDAYVFDDDYTLWGDLLDKGSGSKENETYISEFKKIMDSRDMNKKPRK